jgi:hypothetical protein
MHGRGVGQEQHVHDNGRPAAEFHVHAGSRGGAAAQRIHRRRHRQPQAFPGPHDQEDVVSLYRDILNFRTSPFHSLLTRVHVHAPTRTCIYVHLLYDPLILLSS